MYMKTKLVLDLKKKNLAFERKREENLNKCILNMSINFSFPNMSYKITEPPKSLVVSLILIVFIDILPIVYMVSTAKFILGKFIFCKAVLPLLWISRSWDVLISYKINAVIIISSL